MFFSFEVNIAVFRFTAMDSEGFMKLNSMWQASNKQQIVKYHEI